MLKLHISPKHIYYGVNPTEHSGVYFQVDMPSILWDEIKKKNICVWPDPYVCFACYSAFLKLPFSRGSPRNAWHLKYDT